MIGRRWIELPGPGRIWAASTGFVIVGTLLITVVAPLFERAANGDPEIVPATQVLGATFLALGIAVLVPMLYSFLLEPPRRPVFYWWVNFLGGLAGVLTFAVPATLALPALFIFYRLRPGMRGPEPAKDLAVAGLLTVTGIATLVLLSAVAPRLYRTGAERLDASFDTTIHLGCQRRSESDPVQRSESDPLSRCLR